MTALDKSLTLRDPADIHNRAFALLNRAQARIQQTEVAEASSMVAAVAQLTAGHTDAQSIIQKSGLADIGGTAGW